MILDLLDLFISIVIVVGAIAGYWYKFLTRSGAIAAIFVGMAVLIGFGEKGLFLLATFFASSSYWSKYKSSAKKKVEEKLAKGATRDWRQVVANGGAAGLFSLLYFHSPNSSWLIGFVVCLASANSDTWASEIGSLSRKNPIYIRTLKRVEKGTSGAISFLGSAASLAGSFLISIISFWLFHLDPLLTLLVFLFGYIGNLIDTLIGAFYQKVYICQQCEMVTEKEHHCHQPTVRIKGFTFMDNDMVNFLSGLIAALLLIVIVHSLV